jgi:tetratricopeptide (TPR) repeat protein
LAILLLVIANGALCPEKKLASTYINLGISDYNKGSFIEAILNFRSAEQLSPNPVNVNKYLGMAYSKMSLWQQAAKEFNKILIINPSDPDRSKIIEMIREWEKMKEYTPASAQYSFFSIKYKNKIYAEPDNLLNYLSLTEIYKCSGRYLEAENFFRALVKDRPDKMVFKKYLAEVLFLDGKYGEAGGLYRKILEDEPLNTDAILGLNLIIKKRVEDMMAKNPENMVNHLKLARALKDLKRYEDSIAEYDKFLAQDSANSDVTREKEETELILQAVTGLLKPIP